MKKMKEKQAFFVQNPRRITDLRRPHLPEEEKSFEVIHSVALKGIDYENFCQDMTVSRDYLEAVTAKSDLSAVSRCVLVYARKEPEASGVLVIPTANGYVGFAAYIQTIEKQWLVKA